MRARRSGVRPPPRGPRSGRRRSRLGPLLLACACLALFPRPARAELALAYLAHLGAGQARLLLARQPLTPERVAALTDPEQRALAALRRALELGASLDLARTTSYRALVEADRGTVHVVVAAPANQLEAVSWWFPISGRVSYRGYFAKERAERFAADLAADGLDTYVRPAPLYSTLGFFDDPIPREALSWPEPELVDTILHELVHQTVFVPGDLEYDEALASFVAHHATAAFYADRPEEAAHAAGAFADELTFARLLDGLRLDLEQAYQGVDDAGAARERRAPIFARYQGEAFARESWRTRRFQAFPELALSNAWLVANRTYVGLLPCFEAELAALGGDLAAFVRAHRDAPGHRFGACAAGAAAE
jgi:predicted aminopeptidase